MVTYDMYQHFKNIAPFSLNCISHFNNKRLAKTAMHLTHSKGKENGHVNPIFMDMSTGKNPKGELCMIAPPQMETVKTLEENSMSKMRLAN